MTGEFDVIRKYFNRPRRRGDVPLGPGDDAAILRMPAGSDLVATTDTSIAGRHFPCAMPAADIGWRALAVNLSDLAAMGATPAWFTLALTLPETDEQWLAAFSDGLYECADTAGIDLVGGDVARGDLSITIQALGHVPAGRALRRDRAKPGDLIGVTGTLGDAALGLHLLQNGYDMGGADAAWLLRRLYRPQARADAGLVLRDKAHACIDISDGFAADLGHILEASGAGAVIDADSLPVSAAFERLCGVDSDSLQCTGDDYELCVCLAPADFDSVRERLNCSFTPVGRITTEPGLHWQYAGVEQQPPPGFEHFPGSGHSNVAV